MLDRQRSRRVDRRGLAAFLRRVAQAAPRVPAGGVALCLVSDRAMRRYNRVFRGHDRPTDVLS
ncbi:MAG TPA: rRNA maturation RNAse YbeY, partial [Candidatus Polarisedimenticolaceae bacterium]|nr:rRNA maturation RNAse YbeY [Candidatus Polarisedimenticolaceae bacterium]